MILEKKINHVIAMISSVHSLPTYNNSTCTSENYNWLSKRSEAKLFSVDVK